MSNSMFIELSNGSYVNLAHIARVVRLEGDGVRVFWITSSIDPETGDIALASTDFTRMNAPAILDALDRASKVFASSMRPFVVQSQP